MMPHASVGDATGDGMIHMKALLWHVTSNVSAPLP
jgi:hypothetical protein